MKRLGWAALLVAFSLVGAAPVARGAARQFVLSPEGNHLWAYDAATHEHQLLARAENGTDPGAKAPNNLVRDINGQICVAPDGAHVITGEDTVFGDGSSHDPRIAGWGYFAIRGDSIGTITIDQVGKLAPAAGAGPGYTGDPDNYGCGFLDADRLFTTAIGNTLPGEPANGQLFLWFGPFDREFRRETDPKQDVSFFVGKVPHCEIDHTLATAGGISVAPNGDVYVAANRPTQIPGGDPAAIWRYSGRWPRNAAECTPAYLAANITKSRVLPALPGLPADPTAPTPSAVLVSPTGTLIVSSVFSGTVSEYSRDGQWMRDIYPLSPVAPRTGPTGQTPFGLAVTADNTLWIADLGIALAAPAPGQGSLIAVPLDGAVALPTTVRDGLTFPDGVGVYTPRSVPGAPPTSTMPAPPAQVAGRSETLPATGATAPLGVAAVLVVIALVLRRFR